MSAPMTLLWRCRPKQCGSIVVLGDLDGDGIFDHEDPDKDNDGVCNKAEAVEGVCTAGPDAFPEEKSQWADSDGDGVGDNLDGCDVYFEADESPTDNCTGDAFPDDSLEWADADADGIGDNSDDDDDNDGLTDILEVGTYNTNPHNVDSDADGINDKEEVEMWFEVFEGATTIPDTDGDGQPNHLDKDSDNDGWPDGKEDAPLDDFDSDGLVSVIDPDSDNDGLDDGLDMAASFKSKSANAPDPGNGQGGFAGNRVGGGQNVGGNIDCSQTSGEIQDECQDWRKQHPRRFNTYEKELMSGDLTGTSAIADYDCWSWTGCDCEFDSYDRSPSC